MSSWSSSKIPSVFSFMFLLLQMYLSANYKLNHSVLECWHWEELKKSSSDICHPSFNRHLSLLQSAVIHFPDKRLAWNYLSENTPYPQPRWFARVGAHPLLGRWWALINLHNKTTILCNPTPATVTSSGVEMGQLWPKGFRSGLFILPLMIKLFPVNAK